MSSLFCKSIIIVIIISSVNGYAETLSVALFKDANPPYSIIKNGQQSGIFVDIFAKLSQLTPYHFIFKSYPAARAFVEFDEGRVDIEAGINEKWRQHVKVTGMYSIPYGISTEVIVFKKKNYIKINGVKSLYDKTVGIVRGYSYPKFDAAFANHSITKVTNRSEKLLLKQLKNDRIKYIFIGYRTIKYYMQQNPQYRDIVIGDVVSTAAVKLRIQPNKAYALTSINAGLKKLLNDGSIEKIYEKYQ